MINQIQYSKNDMQANTILLTSYKRLKMKKEKKSFNVIKLLKKIIKAKKSTKKNSKPEYQPSWMYRNE